MKIKDSVLEPYSVDYDFGGWQVKEGERKGKGVPFKDLNDCVSYIVQQRLAAIEGTYTIAEYMKIQRKIQKEVGDAFANADKELSLEEQPQEETVMPKPSLTIQE